MTDEVICWGNGVDVRSTDDCKRALCPECGKAYSTLRVTKLARYYVCSTGHKWTWYTQEQAIKCLHSVYDYPLPLPRRREEK